MGRRKRQFLLLSWNYGQANAAWNHRLYYQEDDHLYVTMYADSQVLLKCRAGRFALHRIRII
mgnify:CR=1 FL=1